MAPVQRQSWYKRHLGGRRLAWYLFFYGSHIALFSYGWWKQASDLRLAGLNTLKFSVWFSRGEEAAFGSYVDSPADYLLFHRCWPLPWLRRIANRPSRYPCTTV